MIKDNIGKCACQVMEFAFYYEMPEIEEFLFGSFSFFNSITCLFSESNKKNEAFQIIST